MKDYFSIQWHITDLCDQRCKHCYVYQSGNDRSQELPEDKLVLILEDYLSFCHETNKLPHISITDGDPLLSFSFWSLVTVLSKRKIPFNILGNPFHLSFDIAQKLKSYGCKSYQMSIDGLEETHDFLRKRGSFQATLDKIGCINEAGLRSVIMTTVSRTNVKDIPDVIRCVVEHNVSRFAFARYCPTHNDIDNMLSPSEYRILLEECWNIFMEYKDQKKTLFNFKDHLWKLFLYEKGIFKTDPDNTYIIDGCHCAIAHMTILPDGTVYACRRFNSPVGKVPEMHFIDIFQNEKMNSYRNFYKFKACSKCPLLNYCRGCPAVTFGATGNFYEKDPQCWFNEKSIS